VKHVQIDQKRYAKLIEQYGPVSFKCLMENDGRVLCLLDGYRFDYSRVVLRPVLRALTDRNFENAEDILDFAMGEYGVELCDGGSEDEDPIIALTTHLNPECGDCGEAEQDCMCAENIYKGESGEFAPIRGDAFDLDEVMSRISGAHGPERRSR
jgi:hypothetical protein